MAKTGGVNVRDGRTWLNREEITMSDHMYGNLGKDMKAMKRERAKDRSARGNAAMRRRSETAGLLAGVGRLLEDIGKAQAGRSAETREVLAAATAQRSAQTRRVLADAQADLKVLASQTAGEAARLAEAIRKSVADLKAEAHQITADAHQFLADTSAANSRLRDRTRRCLSAAQAERKTQWRQGTAETQRFVAGIRKDVAALRVQAGQIVAEAAAMLGRFTSVSQQRATEWQDIVRGLQDGCPVGTAGGRTMSATAAATTAGAAKKHCEKASRHGGGRRGYTHARKA
jgi:hypothetical protein